MTQSKSVVLVLALSLVAAPAFADWGTGSAVSESVAPDRVGHWEGGFLLGGAFNDDSDNAMFSRVEVDYGVNSWFGLGFEVGYQNNDTGNFDKESLSVLPILVNAIFRCPHLHPKWVPYGTVGLGFTGAWVEDEDGSAPDNNGDDVDDIALGWKLALGVDYMWQENWTAFVETAYYGADHELIGSSLDDVDFLTLGGGVKFVN